MQDSYNELINNVSVIKLIDCEVNWIDFHKEINAFCNVTQEEYNYWKDKKILIKDVSSNLTNKKYGIYLEDLGIDIKKNRKALNITDTDLQDLRDKREEQNFIANSLNSLIWDDWGRDHEHFGGKWLIHAEKGTTPKGSYNPKFYVSKLLSIFRGKCKVNNEGSDYDSSNHFATNFITNEGERVYITGGLLELLRIRFYLRQTTLNDIIDYLEPINTKIVKPQEQLQGYDLEFDNTTLTKRINDDMIDLFLENEKRLKADGYITSKNTWISGSGKNQTKTRKDLANLILLLVEKKYLKPKFDRKHLKESDYKHFFEIRYGCNLKEQFAEAKKDTIKSLETAKITFFYF